MPLSQEEIIGLFENDVLSSDPQAVSFSAFTDVGNGGRKGSA